MPALRSRTLRSRAGALTTFIVTALAAPGFARAQSTVPGGGSLLAWLGFETGDRWTYATTDGERVCVEVGEPSQIAGRPFAPLVGMPWPGLATDSRIFVPLDGTLGIATIRSFTLRRPESIDWLLRPAAPVYEGRPGLADPGASLRNGWYVIGDSPDQPFALLFVWCRMCMDAGTYVWMERGRGITMIEERTLAGFHRTMLVAQGCEAEDTKFDIYVVPDRERRP